MWDIDAPACGNGQVWMHMLKSASSCTYQGMLLSSITKLKFTSHKLTQLSRSESLKNPLTPRLLQDLARLTRLTHTRLRNVMLRQPLCLLRLAVLRHRRAAPTSSLSQLRRRGRVPAARKPLAKRRRARSPVAKHPKGFKGPGSARLVPNSKETVTTMWRLSLSGVEFSPA